MTFIDNKYLDFFNYLVEYNKWNLLKERLEARFSREKQEWGQRNLLKERLEARFSREKQARGQRNLLKENHGARL